MNTEISIDNQDTELVTGVSEGTIENLRASTSEATRNRYRKALASFVGWCESRSLTPMPATAETVADYISAMKDAGLKWATIQLSLAAIGKAHEVRSIDPPTKSLLVRQTFRGITRIIGKAQRRAKAATKEDIWKVLQFLPNDALAARDRALLLIGFNAALRRAELVALNLEDVTQQSDGWLTIHISRSKTDQEGEGIDIAIPSGSTDSTCAALALRNWTDLAKIDSGPIFRRIDKGGHIHERLTPQSVALIIKKRCKAAGIDHRPYSGHSLRAGLATSAALAGATSDSIRRTTRHESPAMLQKYVRVADMRRDNAAAKVGL